MIRYDAAELLDRMAVQLVADVPVAQPVLDDEADGVIPAELRAWLLQLRLLQAVPFAYLVPDTALLPEESIRWFYLDRRWTDALVQGALSVGTANSDDRTHLAAHYPAVRAELDAEERNSRRRADQPKMSGGGGPVSGFLLRSRAVSGWPALHVRAFDVDPEEADDAEYPEQDARRIRLLRLERLAPAVLLCLFDGIPKVVHLEEPRQGVQFGFDDRETGTGRIGATLRPRDANTFEYLDKVDPVDPVDVPFRTGASGVVDIKALEKAFKPIAGTGAADGLTSAEYALQLVRFPYRQVWGDPEELDVVTVFKPTVRYAVMVTDVFAQERT
jgi:hypothetical protein